MIKVTHTVYKGNVLLQDYISNSVKLCICVRVNLCPLNGTNRCMLLAYNAAIYIHIADPPGKPHMVMHLAFPLWYRLYRVRQKYLLHFYLLRKYEPYIYSENLSLLILAPVTLSYRSSTFSTTSMSLRHETKVDTSSAYAKVLARSPPGSAIPRRVGLHALSGEREAPTQKLKVGATVDNPNQTNELAQKRPTTSRSPAPQYSGSNIVR